MQGYCMDSYDNSCLAYYTYLARIEQIENSMSAADWRLALPDLEKLLKMDADGGEDGGVSNDFLNYPVFFVC